MTIVHAGQTLRTHGTLAAGNRLVVDASHDDIPGGGPTFTPFQEFGS